MGVYTGHCTSIPSIGFPIVELQQRLGPLTLVKFGPDWSKDTIPQVGDRSWMSAQPDLAKKLEGNVC